MTKILEAYIACNSLANARKVVAHVRKHPMVMCILTKDHVDLVNEAINLVEISQRSNEVWPGVPSS